jgi:chromate reductase
MASPKNVAVLVGSLRKGSFNRKFALALIKMAPPSLALKIVEIRQLALYNQDTDEQPPETWVDFRKTVAASDAVLFMRQTTTARCRLR